MKKVNTLTTSQLTSKLYFFPLRLHVKSLQKRGLAVYYYYQVKKHLFEADCLVIDQKYAQQFWKDKKEKLYEFLSTAKKECPRVLWFDTTDSTSLLAPEVLPYVDGYYKAQLFKKLEAYSKPFYSNRIFSDYYHQNFGISDKSPVKPVYVESDKYLDKVRLFWNFSLSGFFGIGPRRYYLLKSIIPLPAKYLIRFIPPEKKRHLDLSCRLNITYDRESIAYQRQKVVSILKENFQLDTSPLPRKKYLRELRKAKIAPSPFGWGESCFRDFEIIVCGSALMKPDMSHLQTWPDFYLKNKTYISHSWDFSDFIQQINYYLENNRYTEIAKNAQILYHYYLYSQEGHQEFVERATNILTGE